MAVVDLIMPKLGESIMEATILKWHKKPGDAIASDETVLDIATDKVDSEVPSTAAGILAEVLYKENDVVPIGAVIARIQTNGSVAAVANAAVPQPQPLAQQAQKPTKEEDEEIAVPYVPLPTPVIPKPTAAANRFYSPLVLNIANSEGISMTELETIPGTGNDNRVSKNDILKYLESRGKGVTETAKPAAEPATATPAITNVPATDITDQLQEQKPAAKTYSGNVEIIEMDRMRKIIAKHMVESKHTSPHVTSFSEADVTNMVMWRDKVKHDFERRENTKITFTPLFIDCIARVIKRFPLINSSLDGDNIILRKDINIGMATAMPAGNLIVPVIKNADYLNLIGLSKAVNSLAMQARHGKLKPDNTQGGTFTFTNVGTFGSLMGTPIINQPQVAILAVGVIKKRPVVIETPQGDTIGIRHMMYLSLSYDHRIVDGSIGASFLTAVSKEMENWDVNKQLL